VLVDVPSGHAEQVVVVERPGCRIQLFEQARLDRIRNEIEGNLRVLEGRSRFGCELRAGPDAGPDDGQRAAVLDAAGRSSTDL
jgi:hypothetical protein